MEFKPRPLYPRLEENTTPAEQMAKLLCRKRAQDERLLGQLDAQRKQYLDVLTELALDIHRKRHFDYAASFRTLSAILEKAGVSVKTYEGEALNDEMQETLSIVQWLPPNGDPADRVAEAFEPEIWVCGTLTHRAKLICRMGGDAPDTVAPPKDTAASAPEAEEKAPEAPCPAPEEAAPAQESEAQASGPESAPEAGEPAPPPDLPAPQKGSMSRKRMKNKKKTKK